MAKYRTYSSTPKMESVENPANAATETTVEAAPAVAEDTVTTPPVVATPAVVAEPAKKVSNVSKVLIDGLTTYVQAMAPNKIISESDGARHQKAFRNVIINALTVPDEKVAIENLHYILSFINDDTTGTFKIRSLYRFYDITAWNTKEDRREIESLLALFEVTANPATRAKECSKIDFSSLQRLIVPTRSDVLMRRIRLAYNLG